MFGNFRYMYLHVSLVYVSFTCKLYPINLDTVYLSQSKTFFYGSILPQPIFVCTGHICDTFISHLSLMPHKSHVLIKSDSELSSHAIYECIVLRLLLK